MKRFGYIGFLMAILAFSLSVQGEDVVITRSDATGKSVKRRGTIVDWKGDSLILSSGTGERRIPNDEIVQVQTVWQEGYLAGKSALERFQFGDAVGHLQAALAVETRPWAKRMIQARLVAAFQGAQQPVQAIRQFLVLTRDDPQTRFFHLIPLAWSTDSLDADAVVAAVKPLADSPDVIARLIAASWLINDSRDPASRPRGQQLLEELARDIEPRIATLAGTQLWRMAVVTADSATIERWAAQVEGTDPEMRFGGRWLIAEALARQGESVRAAVEYLTLPILHGDQHGLVPMALYKAGQILQNEGDSDQAARLWQELQDKYPGSRWARLAATGNRAD